VPAYNAYIGGQNTFLADNVVYDDLSSDTAPEIPGRTTLSILGLVH
jgi:hypothetical protein